MIKDGFDHSQKLFDYSDGKFLKSELDQIEKRIAIIFDHGFHDADSAQVFISAMVGLLAELLAPDCLSPKSKKYKPIEEMIKKLEDIYEYFSSRNGRDEYDRQGLELTELIKQYFPVVE